MLSAKDSVAASDEDIWNILNNFFTEITKNILKQLNLKLHVINQLQPLVNVFENQGNVRRIMLANSHRRKVLVSAITRS